MKRHWKQLSIPPSLVALCWSFIGLSDNLKIGLIPSLLGSTLFYALVFCFAALLFALFAIPCTVLATFIHWIRAPLTDKIATRSAFVGWLLALIVLLAGFSLTPWSKGWP